MALERLFVAAVPEDLQDQADLGQEGQAEPPHPPVDSAQDRQHHPVCTFARLSFSVPFGLYFIAYLFRLADEMMTVLFLCSLLGAVDVFEDQTSHAPSARHNARQLRFFPRAVLIAVTRTIAD